MASIFEDLSVALAILPVILLPLILYSGFLLNPTTIPDYLIWIRYISPTQYAVTGLLENEFKGQTLPNCQPVGSPQCTGDQVLRTFGLTNALPMGVNVVLLGVIYVTLVVAAYCALAVHIHRRRL